MGADGSIVIMKRSDWDRNEFGAKPSVLSLYTGTVLGVDAVWGYESTSMWEGSYAAENNEWVEDPKTGEYRKATDKERKQITALSEWFEKNAESHEVWT